MTPHDLIRILELVPEKQLLLLELVWRCVGEDGQFRVELAVPLAAEVEAALQEARAYSAETRRLTWALEKLAEGR